MSRVNLYIHYDSVTNHIVTRGIDLIHEDFEPRYLPTSMILAEAPPDFGRFDPQTNFKILRTQGEVVNYFEACRRQKIRLSNWIDFDNLNSMHLLTPIEIAEILYLFHSGRGIKSAFFYKLQNNYVYLTMPNGLVKMFYRYLTHFYPRFQRVIHQQTEAVVNESNALFFMRKTKIKPLPMNIVEQIAPLFSAGMKVNFAQAVLVGTYWRIPLNIIEDELTLLTLNQLSKDHIGFLIYDLNSQSWSIDLPIENDTENLED